MIYISDFGSSFNIRVYELVKYVLSLAVISEIHYFSRLWSHWFNRRILNDVEGIPGVF